jgi:hypothetical protein
MGEWGNRQIYELNREHQREIEDSWRNDCEAHTLLDLIDAEFRSDPNSTACFDRRIVERVRCVALRAIFEKKNPIYRR